MSDMNPINNQALALCHQMASRMLSATRQEALPALSSVDNSAQQLLSASQIDRPLSLPSAPAEVISHLQRIADVAGDELPFVDDLIPPREAEKWLANRNWIASETLPFFATEEMDDDTPDAGFSFMKNAVRQMPHVAEKIYTFTRERLKTDLQAYISGDKRITPEAADQAWRHFQVEMSGSQCRALEHIIRTSKTLSADDQNRLLRRLYVAQTPHRDAARQHAMMADEHITLSDLPAGSLSPDTIEMLARFGVTLAELQQFRSDATAAQVIREKLGNKKWYAMLDDLSQLIRMDKEPKEIKSLIQIIGEVNEVISEVELFVLYDLDFIGTDTVETDAKTGLRLNRAESILEKFRDDCLNAYPRFRLHKAISQHNAYLLPHSLLNPQKRDLLRYRDNLPKLNEVLNEDYAQRSRLLRHMDIAAVIFDNSGENRLPACTLAPYGDRRLPFHFFDALIANPAISLERLKYIFSYCNLRLTEITTTGNIDLSWFARFPDQTLRLIFSERKDDSSYFDFGKDHRHPELKMLGAIKEIGKIINPNYDDHKLPELLLWVQEHLAWQGSENDLACALFTTAPGYSLSLCNIAFRIKAARRTGSSVSYDKADVIRDFTHFCRKVTERGRVNSRRQ